MAFSDNLHEFVRANHLNQASVAREMGIDSAKLNAAVNGKRKMDVDEFKKFCEVVHVNPLTLLKWNLES